MPFPKPFYRWRPHPWHGLEVGKQPPSLVQAYIEITPYDLVKYEIDKETGYMRVDRPQRTVAAAGSLWLYPRTFVLPRSVVCRPAHQRAMKTLSISVLSVNDRLPEPK